MFDKLLLNKVEEVFLDDSGSLLGDFQFDDDELEELKEYFIEKAQQCLNKYLYTDDDIMIFIIVVINKLRDWNKEWSANGFWDQVNVVFDDNYYVFNLINTQLIKLYDGIDKVFRKYNRVLFRTKSGDRAFVQTFLYQAMAPRVSFESFVNLAWRKYFDDLECDYSSSDFDFCEYVVNCLDRKISSPDEDTDVQFGATYYQLRTAFKYGVLQNKEKTIKLLDKVLLSIDRVDKSNEEISDNTLGRIITEVVNNNKRVEIRKTRTGIVYKGANTAHTFEQLRPILQMDFSEHEKPTISICFPRLILLGIENACSYVRFAVYKEIDGSRKLLKSFSNRLIKQNGEASYTMSAFSEDITDLLYSQSDNFKLIFVLTADNGNEYDSGKEFFRNYLVFNGEREVKGDTKPGSYYLIVPKEFDVNSNLILFKKENKRSLWKNIYSFIAEDNDSIEYLSSITIFSRQGLPSNVRFENESIEPLKDLRVIKNDETFEVYSSFTNLHISNNDGTNPEHIRIIHEFSSPYNDEPIKEEKRLSDLKFVNHRYLYSADENKLSLTGYHSIKVIKMSATSANKYLLNKTYIVDKNAKTYFKTIPYVHGSFKNEFKLFDNQYQYEVHPTSAFEEEIIEELEAIVQVTNPYLGWSFGTNPNEVHTSPMNLDKPKFISEFDSTNETIILNNELGIEEVFYRDSSTNATSKVFKGDNNNFLLSQFIASGKKRGYFYVVYDNKELPLFSITDTPYISKKVTLQDCILYEDNKLLINISNYFNHDDCIYDVKLTFRNENNKDIELLDILTDEAVIREDKRVVDGYYSVFLSYSKMYAGSSSPFVRFPEEDVEIGDVNRAFFDDYDQIVLNNFSTFEENNRKIKCKDFYLEQITFKEYDENADCIFTAILKGKNMRPQKVQFVHRDAKVIKSLYFIYGTEEQPILKRVNYDISKDVFTNQPTSINVVEFKTIYYRK